MLHWGSRGARPPRAHIRLQTGFLKWLCSRYLNRCASSCKLLLQMTAIIKPQVGQVKVLQNESFISGNECLPFPAQQPNFSWKQTKVRFLVPEGKKTCWFQNPMWVWWRWLSLFDWSSSCIHTNKNRWSGPTVRFYSCVEGHQLPRKHQLKSSSAGGMRKESGLLTAVFTWVVSTNWHDDNLWAYQPGCASTEDGPL